MNLYKKTLIIGISLSLFGCGGEDKIKHIEKQIEDKKQLYMTDIEPLPDFDETISYKYQSSNLTSPFKVVPFIPIIKKTSNNNITPDMNREKEYLEKFQLESLKMQGYIQSKNSIKAIIKDPLGGFHQVVVGDYIGKNYGKIAKILKSEIIIEELISQGESGWVEETSSINKNNDNNDTFEEAQIENIKKMNK